MMLTSHRYYTREVRGPDPNSFALISRPAVKNPNKLLADRRQKEENAALAAELERQQRLMDIKNDWVAVTDKKLKANLIRRRYQELIQQNESTLEARRQKLKVLLENEEQELRREMVERQPTVVDLQDELKERARQMKERREAERLAFVQMKLEQQFREGCEELRSTVSKQHTIEIAEERLEQIRVKLEMERVRKEEEDLFGKLWLADMEAKLKQEEENKKRYNAANQETLAFLEQQIAALNAKRAQEKQLVEEEAKLLKEEEELRNIERVKEEEEKRQKQKDLRDMYTRSIELKKAQQAREAEQERAFDMRLLEQLFEQTKSQANFEFERKMVAREEERRYREYLKLLKEDEARREAEVERICDAEVENDWQKRLSKWREEKAARQALLQEVLEARRQQIEEKLQANLQRREEAQKERELLLQMIANNRRIDSEQKERLLAQNSAHQRDLLAQIAYNRRQTEKGQKEVRSVWVVQKESEEEYRRKVEEFRRRPALERLHPLKCHLMSVSGTTLHP